ncbi:hypothetical protein L596_025295 [Steinernema carpocapsae]|uniref:Uncharacterized protein n=1 Tax=Steinernema carpocapsae TaxID=34508 RepID=A0A4U5M7D7_STECR|nr:hypothetical protein L596_025295 [Steinernema carpocapsae]
MKFLAFVIASSAPLWLLPRLVKTKRHCVSVVRAMKRFAFFIFLSILYFSDVAGDEFFRYLQDDFTFAMNEELDLFANTPELQKLWFDLRAAQPAFNCDKDALTFLKTQNATLHRRYQFTYNVLRHNLNKMSRDARDAVRTMIVKLRNVRPGPGQPWERETVEELYKEAYDAYVKMTPEDQKMLYFNMAAPEIPGSVDRAFEFFGSLSDRMKVWAKLIR